VKSKLKKSPAKAKTSAQIMRDYGDHLARLQIQKDELCRSIANVEWGLRLHMRRYVEAAFEHSEKSGKRTVPREK
jgi:hypothetical protein